MSKVNTQSVREEAERIKSEFARLAVEKKFDTETTLLFQSIFMLVNLLISIFLERVTKKTAKNS